MKNLRCSTLRQEMSQFYLHTLCFICKHNEPYLPLPSQPQLELIYRPWRDGRLSRPWCEVALTEIWTCNLPIISLSICHTAASATSVWWCLNWLRWRDWMECWERWPIAVGRADVEQSDWSEGQFDVADGLLGRGDVLWNQRSGRGLRQGCAGCLLHGQIGAACVVRYFYSYSSNTCT